MTLQDASAEWKVIRQGKKYETIFAMMKRLWGMAKDLSKESTKKNSSCFWSSRSSIFLWILGLMRRTLLWGIFAMHRMPQLHHPTSARRHTVDSHSKCQSACVWQALEASCRKEKPRQEERDNSYVSRTDSASHQWYDDYIALYYAVVCIDLFCIASCFFNFTGTSDATLRPDFSLVDSTIIIL